MYVYNSCSAYLCTKTKLNNVDTTLYYKCNVTHVRVRTSGNQRKYSNCLHTYIRFKWLQSLQRTLFGHDRTPSILTTSSSIVNISARDAVGSAMVVASVLTKIDDLHSNGRLFIMYGKRGRGRSQQLGTGVTASLNYHLSF